MHLSTLPLLLLRDCIPVLATRHKKFPHPTTRWISSLATGILGTISCWETDSLYTVLQILIVNVNDIVELMGHIKPETIL